VIHFVRGNVLKSNAMALVNTVNTVGIMGKGIAYQFKKAYPEMYKEYQSACKLGEVQIGKMWIWKNPSIFGPQYIINFPTKQDWRNDSRIEDVEKGLDDLVKVIKKLSISSIAIPPLGCGNGKLKWEIVKDLIINAVSPLNDVSIEIFEPISDIKFISDQTPQKVPITSSIALVVQIIAQYFSLGYEVSLLEVQKLCFFLQEMGAPLRLNYAKGKYGPYADNLRHLLLKMEGSYTLGFGDGSKINPDTIIDLTPDAASQANAYLNQNTNDIPQESLRALKLVRELIYGFESPFGLELLSTCYWVVKHEGTNINNIEQLIQQIHRWSPRKKELLKPEYIKKSISRLKDFIPEKYLPQPIAQEILETIRQ